MPLDPCPTYRMWIMSPGADEGPTHVLNCAALGKQLMPGGAIDLDMVMAPKAGDPIGYQPIAWKLITPSGFQAFAILHNVLIQ